MAQILLIEPDASMAEIYAAALRARQHRIAVATTAQAAILAADAAAPDLVLLELQLTAHSGVEFLYEFRSYADWQRIPVVVMSTVPPAEFEASRTVLFEQLGVAAYLYKPRTNLKLLLHTVNTVLAV